MLKKHFYGYYCMLFACITGKCYVQKTHFKHSLLLFQLSKKTNLNNDIYSLYKVNIHTCIRLDNVDKNQHSVWPIISRSPHEEYLQRLILRNELDRTSPSD